MRHGSRWHHLWWHTSLIGLPTRVWFWSVAWVAALDLLLPVPWWASAIRASVVAVIVTWCCHYFTLHTLWLRVTHRRLLRVPPVLNEDGEVSVPVLLPGEALGILRDFDGRPVAGAVFRRDGSIRVEADWTHRA